MKHLIHFTVTLFAALLVTATAGAQARPLPGPDVQKIYDRLLPQIEKIPLYDNHAHPGFGDDSDVDAMAAPPGETDFMRTRADNPEFITAAKQMLGYPYNDFSPEHLKWLADKIAKRPKRPATQNISIRFSTSSIPKPSSPIAR